MKNQEQRGRSEWRSRMIPRPRQHPPAARSTGTRTRFFPIRTGGYQPSTKT
ncbi:MAG: hypothetical protein WBV99_04235 [Candidatus Binatus sp.]|jgi:hypothetical protein